jgi:hypothetical protein
MATRMTAELVLEVKEGVGVEMWRRWWMLAALGCQEEKRADSC